MACKILIFELELTLQDLKLPIGVRAVYLMGFPVTRL